MSNHLREIPKPKTDFSVSGISRMIHPITGNRMVLVPGTTFSMGCATGSDAERPVHQVTVSPCWVDENPVTNSAFSRFVSSTGYITDSERLGHAWGSCDGKYSMIPGLSWKSFAYDHRSDHPVILITWNDANAYCLWAGLRLLTEAEWECCARGGVDGFDFPWGNEQPDGSQSNFARVQADEPPSNPVGMMGVNSLGLADLVGNVWQWCSDNYSENYYEQSPEVDPWGPEHGDTKVRRGGAWNVIQAFRLRCANRGAARPDVAAPNMGFRCAANG